MAVWLGKTQATASGVCVRKGEPPLKKHQGFRVCLATRSMQLLQTAMSFGMQSGQGPQHAEAQQATCGQMRTSR